MQFTHIRLENWRNFARVDVDLERRVFLVGANASGKSNFLDVFRFLRDVVSVGGGFQEAVRRRGGVSILRCLAARAYSDIAVQVHIGDDDNPIIWEYELRFNQDRQRRPVIKVERVKQNGEIILDRPDDLDEKDPERLTQTYLEQVYANQESREVAKFFSSIRYLHIVPQLVREPERSVGRTNDPFGGDFLEQIASTPEKTQKARLRRIQDALKIAVPQLMELELWRDDRGTPHLRGRYKNWRSQGAWLYEDQLSDGTLRLMGLLWAIDEKAGAGPLLLEEPELSLHPAVIRVIPQMFARVQNRSKRQIIVSTHSAELLQDTGIDPREVMLLQPGSEGTSIQAASEIKSIRVLLESGLSIAEAVIPETRPDKVDQLPLFADK
ncbi:MAG: AAA family ATPase [Anaerolineae bacterium]|nr:AAA family ATPase [Anaerolineae bacterium]